jgi:hypothetical protein
VSSIQDHATAVLALLDGDDLPGDPLVVYDGKVTGTADHYVLVYFLVQTPDGLAAPDKVSLDFASDVLDVWVYCHCVGPTPVAARAVQGRVRAALLNVTPTITGRTCFPIRWREGQPGQRDEETGPLVVDQVDVYGLTSLPG